MYNDISNPPQTNNGDAIFLTLKLKQSAAFFQCFFMEIDLLLIRFIAIVSIDLEVDKQTPFINQNHTIWLIRSVFYSLLLFSDQWL